MDPAEGARSVSRAEPPSASAQRDVYVPPFRRGRQTADQTDPPARPSGASVSSWWRNDLPSGPRRSAPAAVAPPPATIADAEARGMVMFSIKDICPCNLDGHPCMLPLRCKYKKNIICTSHVSFLLSSASSSSIFPVDSITCFISIDPFHHFKFIHPAFGEGLVTDTW